MVNRVTNEAERIRIKVKKSRLVRALKDPQALLEMKELEEEERTMPERSGRTYFHKGIKEFDEYWEHVKDFGERFFNLDSFKHGATYFCRNFPRGILERLAAGGEISHITEYFKKTKEGQYSIEEANRYKAACGLNELCDEISAGIIQLLGGKITNKLSLERKGYQCGNFGGGRDVVVNKGKFARGTYLRVPMWCNHHSVEIDLMIDFKMLSNKRMSDSEPELEWYPLLKNGYDASMSLEKQGLYLPPKSRIQVIQSYFK